MQAARRVDDDDLRAPGAGGRDAVVDDRRRVAAGRLAYDLAADPRGPLGELLDGRRPERVGGHHQRLLAEFGEAVGELADGRRLASAVDADHEDDRRLPRHVDQTLFGVVGLQQRRDDRGEAFEQLVARAQVLLGGVGLELLDDAHRGGDADVGEDQGLFDLLPELVGDGVEHDGAEVLAQGATGLADVVAQPAEQAAPLLFFVLDRGRRQVGRQPLERLVPVHVRSFSPRDRSRLRPCARLPRATSRRSPW